MRKGISIMAICLTFLFGCQKEELKLATEGFDPGAVYMLTIDNEMAASEQVDRDFIVFPGNDDLSDMARNGNTHIHAHYTSQPLTGFYQLLKVNFTATQNSQGLFGNGSYTRTWGDSLEYTFTLHLTADCLEIDGGDAVFTGLLTGTTGVSPFDPPLPEGTRFWIRVRDNGQGPNAPLDQYHRAVFFNTSGELSCGAFGLSNPVWNFVGPMTDVANESDIIKIN
jgi:hypothetical protein